MTRHHAILVHRQLSAQLGAGLLKQPPPSYAALLAHPPAPTPLQTPQPRPALDHAPIRGRQPAKDRLKPQPITYAARDRLRRAFFRDHPFEAYRPNCLVEHPQRLVESVERNIRPVDPKTGTVGVLDQSSSPVRLDQWVRLEQASVVPSAEDCINFAESLYLHHPSRYTLNQAYQEAVSQFRTLRFEMAVRASFARQEAEHYMGLEDPGGEVRWGKELVGRQVECQDKCIARGPARRTATSTAASEQRNQAGAGRNRIVGVRAHSGNQSETLPETHQHAFTDGKSVLEELLRKSKRLVKNPSP